MNELNTNYPNRPLKIALVVDSWDHPFNGTVVSARRFVDALSEEFNFRIFITPEPGIQHDERFVAFPRLRLPGANDLLESMNTPLAIPNQAKILAALADCDLLHIQYPFFLAGATIKAARKLGIPVICSFHVQPENLLRNIKLESSFSIEWLYRLFLHKFYNQADLVITPSDFAANLLLENGLKKPVVTLSNGIPDHFFSIRRTNTNQGQFHILSVGRLAAEKKQHLIIEAIQRSGLEKSVTLTLAGTGPQQKKLERLAARRGIQANIGRISQQHLEDLYASTDLFVHSSEVELEGMSVMEAMASGICVLASDARSSALSDFMVGDNTRFRSGDPLDLAEKLNFWISNRDQLNTQGQKNRQMVTTRAHHHSTRRLSAIYRQTHATAIPLLDMIHD
jgi:glycosyltransferase involved in cell wall biosynthesis